MPDKIRYFALTPDGNLLIATGHDAVQKWDGLSSSIQDAGMPAPSTAIVLASATEGDITGTLTGYQRWLDADGNPGSLCPISNELTIASRSGSITGATTDTPIVITSASHGLTTGEIVKISGVLGNVAANGIWTVTNLTANTFSLDSSVGAGTYDSGGTWRQGAGRIDYTSVDAPTDSRVVTRQILRTKDGDARTVYVDVETTDLSSTSFSSTNTDDDLGFNGIPLLDTDGKDNASSKYDEPPDYKPFMASINGRMLGTGDLTWSKGAAIVTNSSTTVTGIDSEWTTEMAGRDFWIVGSTAKYEIASVNETAQTLTLSTAYAGTTNQYARYAIKMPPDFRRTFEWSATFAPEAWDANNSQQLPEDNFAGEVSGIIAFNRWTFIFADGRIFRVSFQTDPALDGYAAPAPQRGVINHRCAAIADDYMALMDRRGVYEFSGNDIREMSQPIAAAWLIDAECPWKINWRWAKYFHVVNDPEGGTLRWFVSLTGRYPRHCFAYNRRTQSWWIEEYPMAVPSSALGRLGGRQQVFLGCEGRQVIAINRGSTDGPTPDSGTLRGTCTAAGATWITDSAATFPASASLVNSALHIVDGKGKGQWRKIVSVSGTTINVDMPFLNVPDTTSVYQLGGIGWRWKSGVFRWAANDRANGRAVDLLSRPTTRSARLAIALYENRSETPKEWAVDRDFDDNRGVAFSSGDPYMEVDTTKENGFVRQNIEAGRDTEHDGPRFVAVGLSGVTNCEPAIVYELNLEGASG